jgi:hypothetical protein
VIRNNGVISPGSAIVILTVNAFNGPAGPGDLVFRDGRASTVDPAVAEAYIAAGFGAADPMGGQYNVPLQIGTPIRDAAVDPQPGDYKAPVNGVAPGLSRLGEVS